MAVHINVTCVETETIHTTEESGPSIYPSIGLSVHPSDIQLNHLPASPPSLTEPPTATSQEETLSRGLMC